MDIQSYIKDLAKGSLSEKIGEATGADASSVEKVIDAGLPVILGQLANNAKHKDGAASLDAAIEKDHAGGSLLESLGGLFGDGETNLDGGKILDHVLGKKTTAANERVAEKTGVDVATVAKILTFLAPLVMAYLGKKKSSEQLDADGLSDVLQKQSDDSGNPLARIATAVLDKNGDGNVLDDIVGGFFGKKS